MTTNGWLQIGFYSVCVLLVAKPLGLYLVKVFEGSHVSQGTFGFSDETMSVLAAGA